MLTLKEIVLERLASLETAVPFEPGSTQYEIGYHAGKVAALRSVLDTITALEGK